MIIRPYREQDYREVRRTYAQSKLDELRFECESFELLPLEEDEGRYRSLFESNVYVYEEEAVLGYGAVLKRRFGHCLLNPVQEAEVLVVRC